MKPRDPSVEALKKGAWAWLFPRLVIGLLVVLLAAVYIFWPR